MLIYLLFQKIVQIKALIKMSPNIISSKARRPKNSWYIYCTKVEESYELAIGYKNTKKEDGPYSSSPKTATVKIPWGPPTECEFNVRKDKSDTVKEFKFRNSRREGAAFDEILLNNLDREINSLSQRITALFVSKAKKLLANFLTVAQYSENFVHHTEGHDKDGFRLDLTGVTLSEIEENGGSLAEFRDFIKVAKESAVFGLSAQGAQSHVFKVSESNKRKKSGEDDSRPAKQTKREMMDNAEANELNDPEGLEKKYQSSFIGIVWIPLDNVWISEELGIKPNIFRVCKIEESMRLRYDPSQTVIVVTPREEVSSLDLKKLSVDQQFICVQKVHTLCAFKNLDKKSEFVKLTGHGQKKILCFVINTGSEALCRYGNLRANDISKEFAPKKTRPQDLLQVFQTLSARDSSVNSLKVVERMSKLGRLGPNEETSLRKVCKWNPSAFDALMEVVKVYELYESIDVKKKGNKDALARGDTNSIPNVVFNDLAKLDQAYFEEHFHEVISKKLSLRSLVKNGLDIKEVGKVYSALSQVSGYSNIESLVKEYPDKFDAVSLKTFIGAEVSGDTRNKIGILLENYYNKVTKESFEPSESPVQFEEIGHLDDSFVLGVVDKVDAFFFHMKESRQDLCAEIVKTVLHSDKVTHVGVLVFSKELLCFEVLSFLRSQNSGLIQSIPIFFFSEVTSSSSKIHENIKHGIILGKFSILKPSLPVYYSSINFVREILENVVPPQSRIAIITEPGLPFVQIHTEHLHFKTVYYGSSQEIEKFKRILGKDKQMFAKEDSNHNNETAESLVTEDTESAEIEAEESISSSSKPSTSISKDVFTFTDEITDESSTSPFKVADITKTLDSTQDSGIGSPQSGHVRRLDTSLGGYCEKLDKIAAEIDDD